MDFCENNLSLNFLEENINVVSVRLLTRTDAFLQSPRRSRHELNSTFRSLPFACRETGVRKMGRLNTFRIDYGDLPNKPGIGEVQKFCANVLGLERGEIIRIQISKSLGVTFVTVVDLALAKKVCEEHGVFHDMKGSDGKRYPLTLTLDDGAVEVKLSELSVDVPDADVLKFLGKHGKVQSLHEEQLGEDEVYPGIYTGVRIARMVVTSNIPSWVTINGEWTPVSYFGQRQTCRRCHEYFHMGVSCVQNKKLLVQKSYADAAKQPAKQQPKPPAKQPVKSIINKPSNKQPTLLGSGRGNGMGMPPPPPPPNDDRQPNAGKEKTQQFQLLSLMNPEQPRSDTQPPTNQQPNTSGANRNKAHSERIDGNETDTSVASSTSSKRSLRGRPPGKKLKSGDSEQDGENDL